MRAKFYFNCTCVFTATIWLFLNSACWAVTSKITHHNTRADMADGKVENTVIGSEGTIQLGRSCETIVEKFENVWSINSVVVIGGTVYAGTSPNGGVYKYSMGKLTKIYPPEPVKSTPQTSDKPGDPNATKTEQYLTNEHIFAMAADVTGRLLISTSGEKCRLMRLELDDIKVIFEPNDAKYIFAITIADNGDIYLGTGPKGKIYQLDPSGKKLQFIYDSPDKNILSLATGKDGSIYAGSDTRGLIYKIDPHTQKTTVLYDSGQSEITGLLSAKDGDLYAAATSVQIMEIQAGFALQPPQAGRAEPQQAEKNEPPSESQHSGVNLRVANTKNPTGSKTPQIQPLLPLPVKPVKASYIYKITKDGYVINIFNETAIFFALASQEQNLFVATGNNGRLFSIEPATEQNAVIYEDKHSSQITAIAVFDQNIYLGLANPAKLVKLGKNFASEGTYTSPLVDAGLPAKWGKLQIEADIPFGCKVMVTARSGNVKDANDPTFSDWTKPTKLIGPIQLGCPTGRFCQYKLILQTSDEKNSPLIRKITIADTVPNLAPIVESVNVTRVDAPNKAGVFKISYKAKDDNEDKLIYKIDFKKTGTNTWIELQKDIEADNFEWDSKTVEDGRYEVRVTASDEKSNTPTTKLTASRISEPIIVDNTPPVIKNFSLTTDNKTVTLKLNVSDQLSVIGKVEYTVDSNADWKGTLPDDSVYDTTEEDFTIVIENLGAGEHIIAVKISDDVGNTMYKTYNVSIANTKNP